MQTKSTQLKRKTDSEISVTKMLKILHCCCTFVASESGRTEIRCCGEWQHTSATGHKCFRSWWRNILLFSAKQTISGKTTCCT